MNTGVWHHFSWFDFALLGIVGLSVLISFFRGFLRESVSLIAWLGGLIVALRYSHALSNQMTAHIPSPTLRYVIAFIALFLAVLIAGFIINTFIRIFVDKTGMGFFDRLAGVFFGLARGLLAVTIVVMIVYATPYKKHAWVKESFLAPYFEPAITWLHHFIPEQVKEVSAWMKQNPTQGSTTLTLKPETE